MRLDAVEPLDLVDLRQHLRASAQRLRRVLAAAASFTAVPRGLASALGPTIGASLLASGVLAAPLVACGVLKITYDLLLLAAFRRHPVD